MKIQHLIPSTLILISSTTLQIAATARPLDQAELWVNYQLEVVIDSQNQQGYQLMFPRTVARLARGAQAPKTVLLSPSREYSFVAVCDESCNDVDLIVKDTRGKIVASDVSDYAIAVVPFVPPSEDRYEINVKMTKCSVRNCNFGLGVFVKSNN
ncbi:MAG TPA: hypothetical protein DCL61_04035 [Cyanobacteria bacterium UBA12227]|nr:hypothetical protein [Cyanobacteria bacterium UBA12227]HAX86586.1 hypothetical protein [Cyanobacteria bacterium UBA11370]HBY76242.1 hypothetical protein [Cyanobacteria bacterium UBA11148]